jgi:hypothetical protein
VRKAGEAAQVSAPVEHPMRFEEPVHLVHVDAGTDHMVGFGVKPDGGNTDLPCECGK